MRLYFNPRSPKGATEQAEAQNRATLISIHAPRRERPTERAGPVDDFGISIHAPRRERHDAIPFIASHIDISIHAPRRERLDIHRIPPYNKHNFNPRSPKGATHYGDVGIFVVNDFNPRSPKGATSAAMFLPILSDYFNPRSPKGATYTHLDNPGFPGKISIHAPRRERRLPIDNRT